MRITDTWKFVDYLKILLIEVTSGNPKLNFVKYTEDYSFNQDGEMLVLGTITYKGQSDLLLIFSIDSKGND